MLKWPLSLLLKIFLAVILLLHSNYAKAASIIVFSDNEIESYVRQISTPLLKSAGFDPNVVKFYLVENPNPNAFVAGGQNVFVFSGLLSFINSDDELAGVLAHELSHITEGHLLQGALLAQKSQTVILVSLLIGTIVAALNPAYLGAVLATFTLAPTISLYNANLFYSRADEMQADKHAVTILSATPYSGQGLVNFMKTLQKLEGNPNYIMSWYSTHPLTSTRIQFLQSYLKEVSNNKPCCNVSNSLLRIKVKLDALNLSYKAFINKYSEINDINLYGLAIAELKNSNYIKATTIMESLVKKYPKDKYYIELLADIYYTSNQFNKAYTTYLKITDNREDYVIDLKIARSAYVIGTKNMLENSLKYVNISLAKNNNSPLAWHLKSLVLTKFNKPYLATLAMAQKYVALGDIKTAKQYTQRALRGIKKSQPEWLEAQDILQK